MILRLFALALFSISFASAHASIRVVADLLREYRSTNVHDALSVEVRKPGIAGGDRQDALFEHPRDPAAPARVDYQITLPPVAPGDLLLCAFDLAIADGIKQGTGEDGVRFRIDIDGRTVFQRDIRETRWVADAINLADFSGRTLKLTLVTEAIANTAYDWALWGNPRILHFTSTASDPAATIGAAAVRGTSGTLRLIPDSADAPLEFTLPEGTPADRWIVKDFSFPAASKIRVETTGDLDHRIAPYSPDLRISSFAPANAILQAGQPARLRAAVINQGRGKLPADAAKISSTLGGTTLASTALPALLPGESWHAEWPFTAPRNSGQLSARVELTSETGSSAANTFCEMAGSETRFSTISNDHLRLDFARQPDGIGFAQILARSGDGWTNVAVWSPLFRMFEWRSDSVAKLEPRGITIKSNSSSAITLALGTEDFDASLQVTLEPGRPIARIRYDWTTRRAWSGAALYGPNLYAGRSAAKTWGLFPGLEYLYGGERSSNPRDFAPNLADRRTPHPNKITIPFMAISTGPAAAGAPENADKLFTPDSLHDHHVAPSETGQFTVALAWDQAAANAPAARFSSPNLDEGMDNHRLAVFLPAVGPLLPENAPHAAAPWQLPAGSRQSIEASVIVTPGNVLAALREQINDRGGLPAPNPAPRSFQEELDLCRAGFQTVSDDASGKWSHCIGWPVSHSPGFASLLWLDSQVAGSPAARAASSNRVETAAAAMLKSGGPAALISKANCHIMEWEFPFYYGHLPEALKAAESLTRSLIASQDQQGGWLYESHNDQQADLGRPGDSVLGTCANRASTILRFARITGDASALAAGEKALRFMENFRVPRGGQTWECPMYEPDILAAGYAIRAYLDGYKCTGNKRLLHNALYWAETGVPFLYLWTLPETPMMLGASIPVFGSTFYTHSWLAMPVQWCGLVYSYHLLHLIQTLEKTTAEPNGSPLPLSLEFSLADWRRVVELITVSAMHQQFPDGDKIGVYPDSISDFKTRNPAFINPEDILVNVLALQGIDPDIKTARSNSVVISSGAQISELASSPRETTFKLKNFPGQLSHTLITGLQPAAIRVNGRELPRSATPLQREPGWYWDAPARRAFLSIHHAAPNATVEITTAP